MNSIRIKGLFILIFLNLAGFAQPMPKALLITGNGNLPEHKKEYPPWVHEFQNDMVIAILRNIISVEVTEDLAMLHPDRLAQYDLVISNSLFLTPTKEQLRALHDFVSEGKSYFTLIDGEHFTFIRPTHCLALFTQHRIEPGVYFRQGTRKGRSYTRS